MKIAHAQLNFHIGNFEQNTQKIVAAIGQARQSGADLVIFPELCITGYPPRDFLEFPHFIDMALDSAREIARQCQGIAAVVGCPTRNESGRGKPLFNSALVMQNGEISSVHHKMLLPNYDVFDEYRYFEPAPEVNTALIGGKRVAVTICEDLWEAGSHSLYRRRPMPLLMQEKPECIVNIAASPFHTGQCEKRRDVFRQNVELYSLDIHYVNHIGAQTELIFDGDSISYSRKHEIKTLPPFSEAVGIPEKPDPAPLPRIGRIHRALVLGLQDYFRKLGFKKALVGLSGGIDSAVTLALACEALGAENVLAVMMPSQFSSNHSVSDSEALIQNLGCASYHIPISEVYGAFGKALKEPFAGTEFGLAEENIQARIRGVLLMAISNKHGHILLNTSNKSEAAVGYGTLYGDMCGGLSVIGDVYKTEVYDLAHEMNATKTVIPINIITKEPSAELRPDQKDSDALPPYDVVDTILRMYIEGRKSPGQILQACSNEKDVRHVLRLVNLNEYKRFQTPPILRISEKAFGMGRRMPIVARYLT